jgi:hypothetical protein
MELLITVIIITNIIIFSAGTENPRTNQPNSTEQQLSCKRSQKFHAPTAELEIPLSYSQNPAAGPCHAPANTVWILAHYFISNSHFNAHNIRDINLKFFIQKLLPSCQFVHFQPLRYSATTTHRP